MKLGALFAGYGGLDMAVTAVTGAEVAWVVENDRAASKVLARHGLGPNLGDVTRVDWTQVEPVDVLTGGFPCQDVSHAGKRAGLRDGTRTGLWAAFCDAIDVLRPGLVVAENVRGLLSAGADSAVEPCAGCVGDRPGDVLRALGRVLGDLAGLGYDARWCGLRAADVGAPHGRFRVFVVAYPHGGRLIERDETVGGVSVANPQRHGDVTLLPTPRATDGAKGGPNQRGSSGDLMLPSAVLLPTPAVNDAQRRIVDRSRLDPETGCWIWTGWTNQAATPYGRVSINGAKVYAHRASYEAFVGPIPVGHEVDHLCQVSLCVNPEHLEAVTPGENRQRVMLRRTHCKRGHEFTDENTYWVRPGARACRACRAWQDKARKRGDDVPLLPTPVHNDMGAGKTVEAWDEWTARMKAGHGNGNGHGPSLAIEALRLLPTPRSATNRTGRDAALRKDSMSEPSLEQAVELGQGLTPREFTAADALPPSWGSGWGKYAPAIHRWEQATRPAPPPTEPTGRDGAQRLSAAFVEWMQGLPEGWVTATEGTSRNDQLRMLGNGCVPQQVGAALEWLLGVEVAA